MMVSWSNNTYTTNQIIINASAGTFLGTSTNDEAYGFALGWNETAARWELWYLTKSPEDWHVYHVHATNLASLSAANDSDWFSQSTGSSGQNWRIGTFVNRRNGNRDLLFNRYTTGGQFSAAYRAVNSPPTAGSLATYYDFSLHDGVTQRGYCGIHPATGLGKWVLPYWLTDEVSLDRDEGIRVKTSTISYASADNGTPVDDESGGSGAWPDPDAQPSGTVFNISLSPYNAPASPGDATAAIQAAIDDARAVGGVVTQNNPPVWNPVTQQMEGGTIYRIGQIDCDDPANNTYKLWRLRLEQATTSSNFTRMLRVGLSPDWNSANTGRLLVQECLLDGRQTAHSGGTWTGGFSLEHNHALFCDTNSRVDVRHTTIKRTCGDGISMSHGCNVTARYVHCESCFRGGVVSNVGRVDCVLEDIILVDGDYGCGTDIELFTNFTGNMVLRRITGESDFDIAAVSSPPSHNSVTGPTILVEDSEFTKQRVNFVGDFNTGSITIRGTKFRIGAHQGTGNGEGRIHRPRTMLFDNCDIYLTDQPFKFHPSSAPPNDSTVGSTEALGLAINMFSESVHTLEFRNCRFHVESVGPSNTLPGLFVQNGVSGSKIRLTQGCTFDTGFPVVNYGGCTLEHDGTTSPAGHWTGSGPVVLI